MKLQELPKMSHTAEDALIFLGLRQRPRAEPLRVARLRQQLEALGLAHDEHDLHEFVKALESTGEVTVKYSHHGKPTHMEFKRDLRLVALSALDGESFPRLEEVKKIKNIKTLPAKSMAIPASKPSVIKAPVEKKSDLRLMTKSGRVWKVQLDSDLPDSELKVILNALDHVKSIVS